MSKKLNLGHISIIKSWIVANFVSTTSAQYFTDAEKQQARENIGVDAIIGKLSDLTTTVKTNIVAAINAVSARIDAIVAGSVTGVKGSAESTYRTGDVNITKGNIGLDQVDNTSDVNKPVSTAQQAALNLKANVLDMDELDERVEAIESKIPSAASSSNQLADKKFVEDSISASAATYRGSVRAADDTDAAAQTALATITTKDKNDYAYVEVVDTPAVGFTKVKRYSYSGTAWQFQYALNNTGFTSDQLAALNSGITATLAGQISTNKSDIAGLKTRMTTAEASITTLQTSVSALESSVSALQATVVSIGSRMDAAEASITSINGKIDSTVTSSNKAQGKAYIDEGDLEATDAEVTAALSA